MKRAYEDCARDVTEGAMNIDEEALTPEPGIAVLHGYDPEAGKSSADPFYERAEDAGQTSPYHRAVALRDSVQGDFPGWIWCIGVNQRGRDLMAAENMRRWLGVDHGLDDHTCSTPECPGDGRYMPPGKGHLSDCQHLRIPPVQEDS